MVVFRECVALPSRAVECPPLQSACPLEGGRLLAGKKMLATPVWSITEKCMWNGYAELWLSKIKPQTRAFQSLSSAFSLLSLSLLSESFLSSGPLYCEALSTLAFSWSRLGKMMSKISLYQLAGRPSMPSLIFCDEIRICTFAIDQGGGTQEHDIPREALASQTCSPPGK